MAVFRSDYLLEGEDGGEGIKQVEINTMSVGGFGGGTLDKLHG